ncbi:unnamed protein product [Prunus armeniaca]|uniref:Uncharacterized protein n=1 Tax=Prunus armeniaca TaxID=36596 RepID=A0A6J5XTK3_PRUAR|nr:unnamed protein product [Prunus armeniaca]
MAITGATSAALAPPTSTPPPKSKPHSMSKMMMSNGYSSNFRKTHARKGGAQIPYGGEASDNEEAKKFIEIINEGFAFAHNGATHLENFLPILNWFSKEGYEKKLVRIAERSQPEYYTDQIIKGLTLILLMGRTDTSSITLEWAMFNVLNHPDILNKAKVEMNNLPGHGREQR